MTAAADLGWLAISAETVLDSLRRVGAGENPDLVFAELWANTDEATETPDD